MPLFKKIFFAVFIILAVGLGFWAYLNLKNNKKPKVDALTLLPDSCLVYLSTSDFFGLDKKLNSQSLIVDKLKLFNDINRFCNTLRQFDSLFKSNPLVQQELTNNTIHFGIYEKELDWLAAFNVKQLGEQEKVTEAIAKLFRANLIKKNIYEFGFSGSPKFYFSINSGVVLMASKQVKLEEALDPVSKKLSNNPSFIKFRTTLEENKLLSIYVNHALYQKSEAIKKLNLPAFCRNGFYAGMVDIQPSELKMNGYLKPDSLGFIALLGGQEAQEPDFIEALPFACNYFQAYGFDTFSQLRAMFDQQQSASQILFWQTVNDSALYNLKAGFDANIAHYLVDFESGASKQKFVVFKVADTVLAREHLRLMSDAVMTRNADTIFKLLNTQAPSELKLFYPLSSCEANFAAIYHSHIYFSEHEDDLLQLLYNLKSNMLMTENESFNSYRNQNFPERFNYLVYNIPSLDKSERTSFFNFAADSKHDPFENFKHFSFSVTRHDHQLEFRWHLLNETETVNKEQNVLWAVQLDTTSTMKAKIFVNHNTKENELLVQDESLKLYLINAKGTVLWKKGLDEKINSEIFIVDIFKNNRYQLLFSSKSLLHLMDRNGNYLPGYPIKLPAEASSPLSVFDYDNTRDYRLMIACKNNKIYNYSISGKKQDGFVPVHTDNNVRLPIQYIKVGLSDYLVALDEEGKIYTFSRRGEGRIGLKNKATANCSAFYIDVTGNINSTYFIYADDKNSLISRISLSDKKDIVKLNYEVENAAVNFCSSWNHKVAKVIFTKLNAVIAYDINGNLLSAKSFENDLSETDVYEDENHSVFLTRSNIREELLVLDANKLRPKLFNASALPLVSDLFNDNKKYIVITNGNRLSCVPLN